MILSIFNSNVGTGRWAVRRAQEEKHFITREKRQRRDWLVSKLVMGMLLVWMTIWNWSTKLSKGTEKKKHSFIFSFFFFISTFTFSFALLFLLLFAAHTVYVEVWDSAAPLLYYILCHILLWVRRKRSRILRATLCLRIQTLAELWKFPTNAHLNSKEKSDELNSFLFFSDES